MGIWEILQSIGILGALVFSALNFVRGIRHSRIPLIMYLRHFSVAWYEGNSSIVVFQLDFVNNSSQRRIVNNVQVSTPFGVTYTQCPFYIDENLELGIYQLPTGEALRIPISELLSSLLDIPPRQPRYKMLALCLQFPEPSGSPLDSLPYRFDFSAWKAGGDKPLAIDSVRIFPEALRTVGLHTMPIH
jgi:hypothetical protein